MAIQIRYRYAEHTDTVRLLLICPTTIFKSLLSSCLRFCDSRQESAIKLTWHSSKSGRVIVTRFYHLMTHNTVAGGNVQPTIGPMYGVCGLLSYLVYL